MARDCGDAPQQRRAGSHRIAPAAIARRLRALGCAALVALAAGTKIAIAQTVEPYYADTSSYEAPALRVVDSLQRPTSACEFVRRDVVDVGRDPIRVAIEIGSSCERVDAPSTLAVDHTVWFEAPLPAGRHPIEIGYLIDGEWTFRVATVLDVDDGNAKCSRFPEYNSLTVGAPDDVSDRLAAVAADPSLDPVLHEKIGRPISAFRFRSFGGVSLDYAPLDDQHDIKRRIDAIRAELGIDSVATNGFVCFSGGNPVTPIDVVEFFNTGLGHYFMSADAAEIAAVDDGGAGPGWIRTGERIAGFAADACALGVRNPDPLFRFYGSPGVGPNSHFFTADRAECGQVRNDIGWRFEQAPFRVWNARAGACPAQSLAVHRLYNGRAAQNDSNHRYTTRQPIVDAMRAAGWIHEGVTFCVPQQ